MQYRGTNIRVDLEAIGHNARALRASIGDTPHMMAVVKANAYGHGLVPVAEAALRNGADWLGVAIPEEGEALREAGITAPILVLGAVNEKGAWASVENDLTQAVFDRERVQYLEDAGRALGKTAKAHLKCDTGMGRIGVRTKEELKAVLAAIKAAPHVQLTGAFTHMADADGEDADYTLRQIAAFERMRQLLPEGIICHAAASAAAVRYPQARFDMVRQGIALYGCPTVEGMPDLIPALSWHTEIAYVKSVPAGACVSYGCVFRAERETRVATLPVGYGDGYHRALSGKAQVLIGGKRCPVIGRVCMDQIMVDVSDLTPGDCQIGAPVVLLGRQGEDEIPAEELAGWAGTISYEMLLAATARVPILYGGKEPERGEKENMQNGKKKKRKLIYKPYLKGNWHSGQAVARGLRILLYYLAFAVVYLLLGAALQFNNPILRVIANLVMVLVAATMVFMSGSRDGENEVNLGEIAYAHQAAGKTVDPRDREKCYHPLKGWFVFLCALIPLVLLTLPYAVTAEKSVYTLQSLPSWVSSFEGHEEIAAPLKYYEQGHTFTFMQVLGIITRLLVFPFANIAGSRNADAMLLVDRLSPLLAAVPALGYPIGYLTGPRSRAMVHGDISANYRRRQRREKKARQARTEKKNELI